MLGTLLPFEQRKHFQLKPPRATMTFAQQAVWCRFILVKKRKNVLQVPDGRAGGQNEQAVTNPHTNHEDSRCCGFVDGYLSRGASPAPGFYYSFLELT
jgi:hypothetical protein